MMNTVKAALPKPAPKASARDQSADQPEVGPPGVGVGEDGPVLERHQHVEQVQAVEEQHEGPDAAIEAVAGDQKPAQDAAR